MALKVVVIVVFDLLLGSRYSGAVDAVDLEEGIHGGLLNRSL